LLCLLFVALGSLQQWTISATDLNNHPYHQHTHHFQVISYTSQAANYTQTGLIVGSWRDTVPVDFFNSVTIRFRPTNFTGLMLFHCHVILHSDLGEMAIALVPGSDEFEVLPKPDIAEFHFCDDTELDIILGVSIGLGIPLLILLLAMLYFILNPRAGMPSDTHLKMPNR